MTTKDHEKLVQVIKEVRGKVVLSGYPNDIYSELESAGWERVEFNRSCNSAARTKHTQLQGTGVIKTFQKRTECLWLSPSAVKTDGHVVK
jgi:DNA adenine methylase